MEQGDGREILPTAVCEGSFSASLEIMHGFLLPLNQFLCQEPWLIILDVNTY